MLIINNLKCSIKTNTIKFGMYETGTEKLPWYLKEDFEMKPPKDFPLIISVTFEDKVGTGYFHFCIGHIEENDINKLVNKTFEGTFNLNNSVFQLFEITFNKKFLDSNDVKTNIKIKFGELKNNSIVTNIHVKSEDFDLTFDDILNVIENNRENCTVYIPEAHKKYNVLPTCRKYNYEMIVWKDNFLRTIKELTGMTDHETCPYQHYKSYKEFS